MASPTVDRDSSVWAVLAATRFGLALTVLLGHLCQLVLEWRWPWEGTWPQMSAVYGFLLISGFSIAASLDRKTTGYFERRIRRIYPVYLASFTLALLVALLLGWNAPPATVILGTVAMLQAYTGLVPMFGQSWSLALEWWCYTVAPVCRRWNWLGWALLWSSLVWFIKASPLRFADMSGSQPWALVWMWFTGWYFYRLQNGNFAAALLVFPSLMVSYYGFYLGLPHFLTIGVLMLCREVWISPRIRPALNWLGDLSYPLYMVHGVTMGVGTVLGLSAVGHLALAASVAMLHLIDYRLREGATRLVLKTA